MANNQAYVEINIKNVEEAIEKANQLKSLLQEVKQLIDSLGA